jgi:hypothetical protein
MRFLFTDARGVIFFLSGSVFELLFLIFFSIAKQCGGSMSTAKDEVKKMLEHLPDSSSLEKIPDTMLLHLSMKFLKMLPLFHKQ